MPKNNNNLPKSKNFCFTQWKIAAKIPEEKGKKLEIIKETLNPFWRTGLFKYMQAGYEVGGKSGKPHLQGWFQTIASLRKFTLLNKLKKLGIDVSTLHINICKGSEMQNDAYTSKDNCFVNWGKYMAQGNRSDKELARLKKIKLKRFKGDITKEENLLDFINLNISRLILNKKIMTLEKRLGKYRQKVPKCARGNNNPSQLVEIFGKYSEFVTWD